MTGLLVRHRSGLPQPLTSLIGREREVRSAATLLNSPGTRLVTLTGPGGIGKTRLALSVAEQLRGAFPDGVCFVSLASIAEHHLVIPTIIRTLDAAEQADQGNLERLIAHLRERHALLVLDNVEHVVAAAPDIAALLAACPALHVLATGREPLHLQGEYEFPVPPLGTHDVNGGQSDETIVASDAVRLFAERAAQASPSFRLTQANALAVSEICCRLGGLPLALELAAARIKVLPPDDLLARLDQPLVVLTGGPRDAPARQQTMSATLWWSYDLLTPDEQRLFRQLSVFAGGCTLDAVEAIAGCDNTLETLSSLVDKSLVRRADHLRPPARYEMLEPVRQFALERLSEQEDEATSVRNQHARYFLSFVQGVSEWLDGPEGPVWFEQIEAEHDNLRAALRWLRGSDQIELGVRLVGGLAPFWSQRDYIGEGRAHAQTFLSAPNESLPTLERAKALTAASWFWLNQDEYDVVLSMADEAGAIAEEVGDTMTLAHALHVRGISYSWSGEVVKAEAELARSLRLFRQLEVTPMVVRVLVFLGEVAIRRDDLATARSLIEEGLTLGKSGSLKRVTGLALGGLAAIEELGGNLERAEDLYRERLVLYQELATPWGVASTIERLGRLARWQGRLAQAVSLFGAASALRERTITPLYRDLSHLDVDQEFSALRSAMPEDEFQVAWERGREMVLEDAIDLALQPAGAGPAESLSVPPYGLTPREIEVLELIARRRSNRQIAAELFISVRTVERHIENLYRKLDIHSRADAIDFGSRHLQ